MAFPVVAARNTTNGTAATANAVVNLPAGIVAGNLLLVLHRSADGTALHAVSGGGWTNLFNDASDASNDRISLWYRQADGTEGATITITQTSSKFASLSWRITGHQDPAIQAPQISAIATGTSATPNPLSLSPTGGAKDYLWIWTGGWEGEQTSPPAGNPTNYVSPQGANSGTAGAITTNCRVASAERSLNAASEDPPSWTISVSDDWTAVTVAVHPAPPVITVIIGQVTETDLAQTMGRLKTAAVGQVTETDAAFSFRRNKGVSVGQVLESDLSQAVGRLKTQAVVQVVETDLAQPITTGGITVVVGQVLESDLAQAVARLKTLAIAQVLETDLAQGVAWAPKNRLVGLVLETDLAQAVGRLKTAAVVGVTEVDLAQVIGRLKTVSAGQVTETDLAQGITWAPKNRLVGQVTETDLAQAVTSAAAPYAAKAKTSWVFRR